MSKLKVSGNASGTGVITLTAPNTNTDRTITLPDSTGSILDSTSTLDATKLSGDLPAISGASLTGISTGITHASSFKIPTAILVTSNTTWVDLTTWVDMTGSNHTPNVGADVTHSSGVFTFPATGLWQISGSLGHGQGNTKRRMIFNCQGTTDNSSYTEMGRAISSQYDTGGVPNDTNLLVLHFNVTDTTNCKVKFRSYHEWVTGSNNYILAWDDHQPLTFLRLGDSI
jgi:hypothetical protein